METSSLNPRVDAYFAKAKPFALPILWHLRTLIHKGAPGVEESIKWSRPFFEYRGAVLCNISAFTEHCSFGFWGEEIAAVLREAEALKPGAMGSLGRLTSLEDLPSDKLMLGWIRQNAAFIASGSYTSPNAARHRVAKAPKALPDMPEQFATALKGSSKASKIFEAFSPSCRREYIEWIAGAKRPETRDKRIATAVEQIADGKQVNWKYQAC